MVSVDFAEIEALQHAGRWKEAARSLVDSAQSLELAGADFIVLCTNTMHKLAGEIEAVCKLPLLHIADATAEKIKAAGIRRIGLLGTRFTMEQDFYRGRLVSRHGLDVLIPDEQQRLLIHQVIYDELCLGIIHQSSKESFLAIIDQLFASGAEGIILGCTEIELLVQLEDSSAPLFPTTRIHAEAAVDYALS